MSFETPESQAENTPQNADAILRAGLCNSDYAIRKSTEVKVFDERIENLRESPDSNRFEEAVWQTWPELPSADRHTAFKAGASAHKCGVKLN